MMFDDRRAFQETNFLAFVLYISSSMKYSIVTTHFSVKFFSPVQLAIIISSYFIAIKGKLCHKMFIIKAKYNR